MRIATLQLAPKLGDVRGNIARADEILQKGGRGKGDDKGVEGLRLDILVLSEMALTGYNFPNRDAIRPYLEPAGEGACGLWAKQTARRLRCKVCVGYPEIVMHEKEEGVGYEREMYYNSLLVVDEFAHVLANYRKSFLYYTDEAWAEEGDVQRGFARIGLPSAGSQSELREQVLAEGKGVLVNTSFGICMDINPYRFEAPWTAWEFANRILDHRSQLVVISMAWLTQLDREELAALGEKPDLGTLNYWIQRFMPLFRRRMEHDAFEEEDGEKRVIVVFANRVGEEEGHGEGKEPVRYAGTSAILAFEQTAFPASSEPGGDGKGEGEGEGIDVKILCWHLMGAAEEGICFADTGDDPEMVFKLANAGE